ncbi:hypothetical protein Tco_1230448 [Tanacetum coccineum]
MAKLKKSTELKKDTIKPEVRIAGLECNRSLPEGISLVNNKVIKTPKHGIFFTDAFEEQVFQRVSHIHKVEVETLLGYLVMVGNINAPENQRSLNEQSFNELPSRAQPESMRNTQPFSEAALIEDPDDKSLKNRWDKFEWIRSSTYPPEVKLS